MSWLSPRTRELFGVDLRSLALFRVALASTLIVFLINRLRDCRAFFTDWGVLPRDWMIQFDSWTRLSLYFANGEPWFAATLLLITIACAVGLWFGWRTRLVTVLLFVLVGSLMNRNPLILIGGDCLLMCLLFWAMFLPLGARWSVDAALAPTPPPRDHLHVSWASVGILLQMMSVYFFSAWMKNAPDWWPDGLGVYYTMQLERYRAPLGAVLAQFPSVMHLLTYYTYFLEWAGPVLCFFPWFNRPLRFVVMLCFMALHTGFILFMEIGHFPYVNLSGLTVLLGGWVWDWLDRRRARVEGLRIYYDRDCGFCVKSCLLFREFLVLPEARIAPAQDTPRAKELLEANYSWVVIDRDDRAHLKWPAFVALLRHSPLFGWLGRIFSAGFWVPIGNAVYDWVGRHRGAFGDITATLLPRREVRWTVGPVAQGIAGIFVVLAMGWNLATVKVVPDRFILWTTPPFRLLRIDQIWNMFAPYPSRLDGWAVYPGKLEDGSDVDVLTGKALSWERPARLGEHENIAWHTLRWRIIDPMYQSNLLYYGRYLCRDWNWNAPDGRHLLSFDMVYLQEISLPPGQTPEVKRVTAWKHECRPKDTEHEKNDKKNPIENERSRPV